MFVQTMVDMRGRTTMGVVCVYRRAVLLSLSCILGMSANHSESFALSAILSRLGQ